MTQPDDALTTSREVREQHAGRVEVLDKVRALRMLPGDTYVTTEMVAAYYEVGIEAIKTLTKDNRAELEADGYDVIEGARLRSFKDLSGIGGRARSLALFPRRAVLRLGMLLRDSAVARQVRDCLLDAEEDSQRLDYAALDIDDPRAVMVLAQAAQRSAALAIQEREGRERAERALASAAPKADYVDSFVDAHEDVTTVKNLGRQIGMTEAELRAYLVDRNIIFRRACWRKTSGGNQERVWQWTARPKYLTWFTPKDQPEAPRLHNGQMQQTLYVNAVGKQRIKELVRRRPPAGFDLVLMPAPVEGGGA